MAKNVRALTDDEIESINDLYRFELYELVDGRKFVAVICSNYKRINVHPADEDFDISTSVRKITIKKEAIQCWIDKFLDEGYSLIEVQGAMNAAIVTYRGTSVDAIEKQLVRGSVRIAEE